MNDSFQRIHKQRLNAAPVALLWLALGLLISSAAYSQGVPEQVPVERYPENPREDARPCDQIYSSPYEMIDKTRERVEEIVCSAALWVDGIGSDHGNVLAARRSRGRIEMSYYWSQFGGGEFRIRAKVRMELPALKRRLSAFIGLDNENEFVQGRGEGFALRSEFPSLSEDDDWLAGLGYQFPGSGRVFRSDFRIGAKRLTDTKFFVQNRMRYLAYSDDNDLWTLRETLFWTNQDGFGSTTGSDWMHVINKDLLARWDNVATVTQESEGLNWRTAAILYRGLQREGSGIALELFSRGETRHPVPVREYGIRALYRYPLFQQRLFLEFLNGYTWPKIEAGQPREGSYGVGLALQMPFGPAT
ncbi:MAG: hypothetical protein ACSHXK_08185 [Oceanococcus sp.]